MLSAERVRARHPFRSGKKAPAMKKVSVQVRRSHVEERIIVAPHGEGLSNVWLAEKVKQQDREYGFDTTQINYEIVERSS